jgi:hypothetical protein
MLKQMLANGKGSMDLPLKTQLKVYQGHDQIILVGHKAIKQVCWLKTLIGLCPATSTMHIIVSVNGTMMLWINIQKLARK